MSVANAKSLEIIVREATPDDRDFVIATAGRLAEFGPPPWRATNEIVTGEQRTLLEFFDRPAPGAALFIAGHPDGQQVGYVYLETHQDYFTHDSYGHISTVAVNEQHEGQGVGSALMRAAEEWARSNGFRHLTLNVFEANGRAREIYEHLGFRVETLHYVKVLDGGGKPNYCSGARDSMPQVASSDTG